MFDEIGKIRRSVELVQRRSESNANVFLRRRFDTFLFQIDEKHAKLTEMRDRAARLQKEKERDARKEANQGRKVKKGQEEILRALKERRVRLQDDPNVDIFDRMLNPVGSSIQWNDDQTLFFPVVFLYPEYGQTDYIEKFSENTRSARFRSLIWNVFVRSSESSINSSRCSVRHPPGTTIESINSIDWP